MGSSKRRYSHTPENTLSNTAVIASVSYWLAIVCACLRVPFRLFIQVTDLHQTWYQHVPPDDSHGVACAHVGVVEDSCLLECDAVSTGKQRRFDGTTIFRNFGNYSRNDKVTHPIRPLCKF